MHFRRDKPRPAEAESGIIENTIPAHIIFTGIGDHVNVTVTTKKTLAADMYR
jgi:hypothetical protein